MPRILEDDFDVLVIGGGITGCGVARDAAMRGLKVALMDMDPQGSSVRWLKVRNRHLPPIHTIAAYEKPMGVTRVFALRSPPGTERLIVDTPAALPAFQLPEIVRDASAIVVPVMPSEIDIHAASRCIADLLLVGKVHRSERRLVIVANRARRYTKAFQSLMKFLQSLRIPVAAVLRDSQAYVRSAETGMGLHEMKGALLQEDIDTFRPLLDWLEKRTESLVATDESAAVNGAPPADGRESSSVMAVSDEAAAPVSASGSFSIVS